MKGFNWKKITKQSEFYVFLIIVVLSVIIQIRSGLFFANNNIVDIMRSMIVPCIYALCAFLAFISTGPDVSFPLIAALSSYLAITITYKTGYDGPWIVVFIIGMFFGALMGALNGFIIVKYKFSSLIVTLGTSSIFSGLLLGAFEAERMDLPDTLQRFGKASLLTVKHGRQNCKTGRDWCPWTRCSYRHRSAGNRKNASGRSEGHECCSQKSKDLCCRRHPCRYSKRLYRISS